MSTPSSPEKKKGRQASYVPNVCVGQLERNETNTEKSLKQSQLDSFFAGHNDPMDGVTEQQPDNKMSPEKRPLSAILYTKTPDREPMKNTKTKKNDKATKKQEDAVESDFEAVSSDSDRTPTASTKDKAMELAQDASETSDDGDNDDNDDFSLAEVTKVIAGKPKITTENSDDEASVKIIHK
jgi:hypothetical protein